MFILSVMLTTYLPVVTFGCTTPLSHLENVRINHKTKGDFVNVVIYCPETDGGTLFTSVGIII